MPRKTKYFLITMIVLAIAALVLPFPDNDGIFEKRSPLTVITARNMPFTLDVASIDGGLKLRDTSAPANGEAEIVTIGALVYRPLADYVGTDQFTYTVINIETNEIFSRTVDILVLEEDGVVIGDVPYRVERIDVPSAQSTYLTDINDQGEMVGQWWDGNGNPHVMKILADGTTETIPIDGASLSSWQMGQGINNAGQITGNFEKREQILSFVLDADGIQTDFSHADASATLIFKINEAGETVGRYLDNAGVNHGFLHKADSSFETLHVPESTQLTWPLGLNNQQAIVGFYDVDNGRQLQGFYRDSAGNYVTISPPNARLTRAYAINEAGLIVGEFSQGDMGGTMRSIEPLAPSASGIVRIYAGFVRTPTGEYHVFSLPNAQSTSAWGVNNVGNIVGGWVDAEGYTHGYKLTPIIDNAETTLFAP